MDASELVLITRAAGRLTAAVAAIRLAGDHLEAAQEIPGLPGSAGRLMRMDGMLADVVIEARALIAEMDARLGAPRGADQFGLDDEELDSIRVDYAEAVRQCRKAEAMQAGATEIMAWRTLQRAGLLERDPDDAWILT